MQRLPGPFWPAAGVTRDPGPHADGQIPRLWAPAIAENRTAGTVQIGGTACTARC
jgi:hypothetical protein